MTPIKKSGPPFPPSSTPDTSTTTTADTTGATAATSGTGAASGSGTGSGTATASGGQPTTDPGNTPPPQDSPQACQPPPDATVPLPPKVALVNGKPVRPINHIAEQTTPIRQVFDDWVKKCEQAFFSEGQGFLLPEVRQEFDSLCILRSDMDEDLETQDHPTNSKLVPEAGEAVLQGATQVPGGEDMDVDTDALGTKLTRLRFLTEQRQGQDIYDEVLDANIAKEENDINKIVRDGVDNVGSLLKRRTRLRNVLAPATNFIKRNALMAVDSRRSNERLKDKVISEMDTGTEPAQPGTTAPAGQTGTPGTPVPHPATTKSQQGASTPATAPRKPNPRTKHTPRKKR